MADVEISTAGALGTATSSDSILTVDATGATGEKLKRVIFSGDEGEYLNGAGGWGALSGDPTITTVNAATYSLLTTDNILHVTYAATGECTVTWPTAQIVSGRLIRVKDAAGNSNTNAITIVTEGSQLIDGQANYELTADYNSVTIYCDGSNLFVV